MPSNKPIRGTVKDLRGIVKSIDSHARKRTIKLIEASQIGPLDDETIQAVAMLGPSEATHFLRHHPGYKLEEAVSSTWNMLEVFRCACRGIQRENSNFSDLVAAGRYWHRENQPQLNGIQNEMRKEVFSASSAASALVDLSRKVFKKVHVPGHKERIEKEFAEAGDHNLIIGLRNSMSHSWFAPAGWFTSRSREGEEEAAFKFECSELLLYGQLNSKAKQYVQDVGERIDVSELFQSYAERIDGLYNWLGEVIDGHLPNSVHEYRRCMQEQKAYSNRCMWRVLIDQIAIPNKVNPYDHLEKHLTKAELAEVEALPHRSKEQVDRIIELIDEEGACDEGLRLKVYKLFGV